MSLNDSKTSWENIPARVFPSANVAVQSLAREIVDMIRARQAEGRTLVLGLATGSTPVPLYRELIRMHREEDLSFHNVITFNLDEYYPIEPAHPESYHAFMRQQLFDHIDIPEVQVHLPEGNCSREEVIEVCARYEAAIAEAGGLDLQILGIGRTGHIGFNEPGSTLKSRTRLVTLDSLTRSDAAKDFLGEDHVPRHAITMGIGTIIEARRIRLLAWGTGKAGILRQTIEEPPTDSVPASFLQGHDNAEIWMDEAASSELTRNRCPWLVEMPDWTPQLVRRAVTHLSDQVGKPLLKLVDKDYQENGLADLITEKGPAYNLNIRVFNEVQHTITGWPGGKPNTDDTYRPERAEPGVKRVVLLSPEPLDDMLAMGGTLNRLVSQGHEVTVAYATSGSLGVPDEEALWIAEIVGDVGPQPNDSLVSTARRELESKCAYDSDTDSIRRLKRLIRRNEAKASLKLCGADLGRVEFLDLPFYEKGKYRQFVVTGEDVARLVELLRSRKPHQVFFTGSTADPSSVPAKAFDSLSLALDEVGADPWLASCNFWEYAWSNREWDVDQVKMAVPCSPDELQTKIQAIYQHRSQMRQLPQSQKVRKEIWQQVQERNQTTAHRYDSLGLAEYEAIECFVNWRPGSHS